MRTQTGFGLAALALVTAAGCSTELQPRSFVQPNVMKKADLDGIWYHVQTVMDAPPTTQFSNVGDSSELIKIKFEIQENTLYARRAFEHIAGSEDLYKLSPQEYEGQPIAAWKIEKQFDIIREYNSTTGEETNKIIESEERPWTERQFLRVDWSENLLNEGNWESANSYNFLFNDGVKLSSVSFWESDPKSQDAFHLERADDGDTAEFTKGEANYFDVTTKWVLTPDAVKYTEDGESLTIPSCLFYYTTEDCAPQIVKVRYAFNKVSPKHEYEPRKWDGQQMDMFGLWDPGLRRLTYNRQYGITNSGVKRHIARFNLWKSSFQHDAQGLVVKDAAGKPVPLAFDDRELRTIPYYAESTLRSVLPVIDNKTGKLKEPVLDKATGKTTELTGALKDEFPVDLFASGAEVVSQWNKAVLAAAKLVKHNLADDAKVFVFCHNPVDLKNDDAACKSNIKPLVDETGETIKDKDGNPIYFVRHGDPRRSHIMWVNQEQDAGPLGLGPPMYDIETGETISAQSNIYGAALDTYTARSRDLLLLIAGKIKSSDFTTGANVATAVRDDATKSKDYPLYEQSDIAKRGAAMNFNWAKGQAPEAPIDMTSADTMVASFKARQAAMVKSGIFGNGGADVGQALRDKLAGTPAEDKLINSELMNLGGAGGPHGEWSALSAAQKMEVSPLRWKRLRNAQEARLNKMRAFGYDFAEFADEGLTQKLLLLGSDPATQSLDPKVIFDVLRKDIFLAVTLHEMGHNVGLRHNFRASNDSLNYDPHYWDLRVGGLKDSQRYVGINPATGSVISRPFSGSDCNTKSGVLRPRYIDCSGGATSVSEQLGGIRQYEYSSVMDYGAEFNSDIMGLGLYDKAAMKFSYADQGYVEVFTDTAVDTANKKLTFGVLGGSNAAFSYPDYQLHYTKYPSMFKGATLKDQVQSIYKRADVPVSEIFAQRAKLAAQTKLPWYTQQTDVDKMGRYRVPYYFSSDEFAGASLNNVRYDSGADLYESSTDLVSRYQNFYYLNNFKRDRVTFHTSSGYFNRIYNRYLDPLRDQLTWYALLRGDFTDWLSQSPNLISDEDHWGPFTAAVSEGFDLLGRILTKPEPGVFDFVPADESTDYPIGYMKKSGELSADPNAALKPGQVGIAFGDGKYNDSTWAFDACGYYWAEECQTRIGYFLDKILALEALSDTGAYFTGRDTSTDLRRFAIGYITIFQNQIHEKLGALFSGDYVSLAPQVGKMDKTGMQVSMVQPSWTLNAPKGTVQSTGGEGALIDPSTGFTLQLWAAVFGLSEFNNTYDHSFIDHTRIFVVGNGEAPVSDTLLSNPDSPGSIATKDPVKTVGAGKGGTAQYLVWQDSLSGKTYAALSVAPVANAAAEGTNYRVDAAARMLSTAITLDKAATSCMDNCDAKKTAVSQYRDTIDAVRSYHSIFGYGIAPIGL